MSASREVLEAYRLVAADAGWLRRVREVIRGGLTAEAAVQRVAGELHDRMRRISDAYLRERLADMEDLANRLLTTLTGEAPRRRCRKARSCWPGAWVRPSCWIGKRAVSPAWRSRRPVPSGHAAILARALGIPALGGLRGMLDSAEQGDEAVVDADEGQFVLRPEAEVQRAYLRAQEARNAQIRRAGTGAAQPGVTADGIASS